MEITGRTLSQVKLLPAPRYSHWLCPVVIIIYGLILSACSPGIPSTVENTREQPATLSAITTSTLPSSPLAASATSSPPPDPILTPSVRSRLPTVTIPTSTSTVILTPTPDTRLGPRYWRNWPIIPTLSARAFEVFQLGQKLGNDVHAFSRIGDCQSVPAIFLGIYDTDRYWLDIDHADLQLTIDHFTGSFSRSNVTVKDGFGVASVLTPLMADPQLCQTNETPLECEYRLHKPIIAFIAMGTNWQPNSSATFERYLRQIVDFCLAHGIIPILVTKADNIEEDFLLNQSIATVAYDYDMPLLNSWLSVQYLPNHGLEEDKIYLTPEAWDVRNFTALEALDSIWRSLSSLLP